MKGNVHPLLMFILIVYTNKILGDVVSKKIYEPPGNTKYPYGDEHQINTDITLNGTNKAICSDLKYAISPKGKCPFPPENPADMILTDPYVKCPEFLKINLPLEMITGEEIPMPSVQCKSCDVKQTSDKSATIINCIQCYDIPSLGFSANLSPRDILYKVFFIEIANYTSVNVTGQENF